MFIQLTLAPYSLIPSIFTSLLYKWLYQSKEPSSKEELEEEVDKFKKKISSYKKENEESREKEEKQTEPEDWNENF